MDILTRLREYRDTNRPNSYSLKPYLIPDGRIHPVAVICPGGGYRRVCSFVEGHPFARRLNRMGFHAVVVDYRVRDLARYPNPQEDLARAIGELHANAQVWKLDMRGYSVWGSSAGGHLAASFGVKNIGWGKFGLPRPGAMILSYPVVSMGPLAHPGSRNFHLGPEPTDQEIALTSIERHITADYPPTFLWWGDQDQTVDPENSRLLRRALEEKQVPCLCREYAGVGHGVGLGKGLPCEGWILDAVGFWMAQRG